MLKMSEDNRKTTFVSALIYGCL